MADVNYKTITVMLSPKEEQIIDSIRRVHYTSSRSEIIRQLIGAGAEHFEETKNVRNIQRTGNGKKARN